MHCNLTLSLFLSFSLSFSSNFVVPHHKLTTFQGQFTPVAMMFDSYSTVLGSIPNVCTLACGHPWASCTTLTCSLITCIRNSMQVHTTVIFSGNTESRQHWLRRYHIFSCLHFSLSFSRVSSCTHKMREIGKSHRLLKFGTSSTEI